MTNDDSFLSLEPLRKCLWILVCLASVVATGCGGSGGAPHAPPAGSYAFARSGSQLLAVSLDSSSQAPITLMSLVAEADFALPVERLADPDRGSGRYYDVVLFNGGKVFWLTGRTDGRSPLFLELDVPEFTVRACGHIGKPDDPAVTFIRERQSDMIVEIDLRFNGQTGCIDAAGDYTLSIPLSSRLPVVRPAIEYRVGLEKDGSALGMLRIIDATLVYARTDSGVLESLPLQTSDEDTPRVVGWSVLARDDRGAFLCAKTNADRRCALYYFEPQYSPRLQKLSADDYDPVQMAGISEGRAYTFSFGPLVADQLRMPVIYEYQLYSPFAVRYVMSFTPDIRPISLELGVLFYAYDTIRFSQYRLLNSASGVIRDTDLVMYGSGASSVHGDHRIGCVVSEVLASSREMSGCWAEAWITPNYLSGVRDRTVYLVDSGGVVVGSYSFSGIASAADFVGCENAVDFLVSLRLEDGSVQLWRISRLSGSEPILLFEGDVALYGTIRQRGSIL